MTTAPRLPGQVAQAAEVQDRPANWPSAGSKVLLQTPRLSVMNERIIDSDGQEFDRVVVQPSSAVVVLALDEADRVLVITQYRHTMRAQMAELPAGTLDIAGELPAEAAARELAEEGDVTAQIWQQTAVLAASPGYSDERWYFFRATELSAVPQDDRTQRTAEESGIRQWWLPFDEAVQAVLSGAISNALAASAILAEAVRRDQA